MLRVYLLRQLAQTLLYFAHLSSSQSWAGTPRRIARSAGYLLFFCASPTRNGLEDLDLFAGTGVLDKVPDVDDALVASVGALEAGVMRL
jgi:hypothetical protein